GARREALSAFGDDRVLLEKFITRPRHIEVQVFGDSHGAVVHLFERDCSLQRRHQKVVEEAPAPGMDAETRDALCATAVRAAEAVRYEGAGTIEFIADSSEGLRADRIWFMEMNTRLQVEHPVTEAITGLDLVEWQLRVASGEPLPLCQDQISMSGHAIEARLYAEDPAAAFLPSTGPLTRFHLPVGVRVDAGVEQGGEVSAYYDPMIAKLIAHAPGREAAARALADACREVEVWPVKTNAAFLGRLVDDPDFLAGAVETGFIDSRIGMLVADPAPMLSPAIVRALEGGRVDGETDPWSSLGGGARFRLNRAPAETAWVVVDGESTQVRFDGARGTVAIRIGPGEAVAFADGAARRFSLARADRGAARAAAGDGGIRAPMPGRIVSLAAKVGDAAVAGETLAVLEAMKMEHALVAPFAGKVIEVLAGEGDQVIEGAVVIRLEPATA
ncbi:MAG: biotin/lipoyl-containing protein, partial [Caulobacteraceae bacterium]